MISADRPLRIALLTHSTNPRGGVVHALELADALVRLGHEAVVHAPDPDGRGFFRDTLAGTRSVPVPAPAGPGLAALVESRIAGYLACFEDPAARDFDIFHAQDGISSNALVTLRDRGLIGRAMRTVHHVDRFGDARVDALEARSIRGADELFVVSRVWADELARRFGRQATVVGNGVDMTRFSPDADGREEELRRRFGLGAGPVFLSVGGIEARKNSLAILQAFAQVRRLKPRARLVIAGGASVLDHDSYRARFEAARSACRLPAGAVVVTGRLDHAEMPALYRIADTLVFPSLNEGFGLAVIEAMAAGLPVVTATIPPFTEHLAADEAVWCDPHSVASIADAMLVSLVEPLRSRLIAGGYRVAARHDWRRTAMAHLAQWRLLHETATPRGMPCPR